MVGSDEEGLVVRGTVGESETVCNIVGGGEKLCEDVGEAVGATVVPFGEGLSVRNEGGSEVVTKSVGFEEKDPEKVGGTVGNLE